MADIVGWLLGSALIGFILIVLIGAMVVGLFLEHFTKD